MLYVATLKSEKIERQAKVEIGKVLESFFSTLGVGDRVVEAC